MAEKQSFVMHMMWGDIFENLPAEKAGELIQAIYAYQKTGESSVSDPVLSAVFEMMRAKMEDDAEKYWKQVERNKENGKRGGRPKTHNNPQKPTGFSENPVGTHNNPVGGETNPQKPDTDNDTDTDNDNDNEYENDNESNDIISITKVMPSSPPDYDAVLRMFNQTCVSFPRINIMSQKRKQAVKARMRTGYTMKDFETVFQKAEESDFLKGKNDRNWSATCDWMIKDANMAKILDGNYDNRDSPHSSGTGNVFLDLLQDMEKGASV